MVFSSTEAVRDFSIQQRVLFSGACIEGAQPLLGPGPRPSPAPAEWSFHFGFVIPGSENRWDNTIVAAPAAERVPAARLSGHVVVETGFYDGDRLIGTNRVRVFYDR